METTRRLRPPVADAIRIIAMTGARRRRNHRLALAARRSETRSADAACNRAQDRSQNRQAARDFSARSRTTDCRAPTRRRPRQFCFFAVEGRRAGFVDKAVVDVRAEAGLPAGFGLHGLRHSLATVLAVGGAQAAGNHDVARAPSVEYGSRLYPFCRQSPRRIGRTRRRACPSWHGRRNRCA